jgi:putative chitinase
MSLKKLQQLAGVEPDGAFGPNTFKACSAFIGITNHERAVHFFAQTGHETGNFKRYTENLNYSATGLRNTFKKYFPTQELAEEYARQPARIASRVYAGRMGNGPEESGDGWLFKGRGALQLTGKDNYAAFAEHIELYEIILNPDIVASRYSFESAMFFFERNNLWKICDGGFDAETVKKLTKRINGGDNGLEHRTELTLKYSKYKL